MGAGEGLGGCYACIKYLMFAFNFIFWLIGCALVGFGIWLLVDDQFKNIPEDYAYLQYAGIATIVVGGIIMMVGFFGCCGAIRESQCLLVTFFICMLLLFLALVAGGVLALVQYQTLIKGATETLEAGVKMYQNDEGLDENVNLIQSFFKCCGANGPQDYLAQLKTPPETCAGITTGCVTAIEKTIKDNATLFAGVTIGAGAVMLLGMIFSMVLCCAIRDLD